MRRRGESLAVGIVLRNSRPKRSSRLSLTAKSTRGYQDTRCHIFSRFPPPFLLLSSLSTTFAFATRLLRADVRIPCRSGPCHPIYSSNICRLTPFRYYSDARVFPLPLTPQCSYILAAMNFMCESSALLQVGPYCYSVCEATSRPVSIAGTSILM
jgi:hypothetical protein